MYKYFSIIIFIFTAQCFSEHLVLEYQDGTRLIYDMSGGGGSPTEIQYPDGSTKVSFTDHDNDSSTRNREEHKDASGNTVWYKQYIYDPATGDLTGYGMYLPDGTLVREYDYIFDANSELEGVVGAGCSSCGTSSGGGVFYEYDSSGRVIKEYYYLGSSNKQYTKEYEYDSEGDIAITWYITDELGTKQLYSEVTKSSEDDIQIEDTKEYISSTEYRIKREYLDSRGNVLKSIAYEELNDDPNGPSGSVFQKTYIYNYDTNDELVSKTIIPPKGSVAGDGMRKEYTYAYGGSGDGRYISKTTVKRFTSDNSEKLVSESTYGSYSWGTGYETGTRLLTDTDRRGAITAYTYNSTFRSLVSDESFQEVVLSGVNPNQRLGNKFYYISTGRNKGKLYKKEVKDLKTYQVLKTLNYEYDDFGRIEKTWEGTNSSVNSVRGGSDDNIINNYYYNVFGDEIWHVSPAGVVTGKTYNDNGRVESEFVYAGGYTTFATIDPYNPTLIMAISQTKYTYDPVTGKILYVDNAVDKDEFQLDSPSGWTRTEYHYDRYGRKDYEIRDALALDEQSNVLTGFNSSPMQLKTEYEYNLQGEIVRTIRPDGTWTKTIRDGRGLPTKVIISSGTTVYPEEQYVPGANSQIDPDPNVDGDEILYSVTQYRYDANGNLIVIIHPDGTKTVKDYDDFDRQTREFKLGS